jgi:hypothetical protein
MITSKNGSLRGIVGFRATSLVEPGVMSANNGFAAQGSVT